MLHPLRNQKLPSYTGQVSANELTYPMSHVGRCTYVANAVMRLGHSCVFFGLRHMHWTVAGRARKIRALIVFRGCCFQIMSDGSETMYKGASHLFVGLNDCYVWVREL